MEYLHGKPTMGLKVKAPDLAEYERYARQYIAKELLSGAVTVDFDFSDGFTMADSLGRQLNPAKPPPQIGLRFIHRVPVVQRWELRAKRENAPAESRADHHAFFFDVTECLPEAEKTKIEATAGVDRSTK